MQFRPVLLVILGLILACLAMILFYNLPPVHQRLAWRVTGWQAQVRRVLNPPEQRVFVPQGQADPGALETVVEATSQALQATPTPMPGPTDSPPASLTPASSTTPKPTATATPQPTPIPEKVVLSGIVHEYQQFNNCGPANLAMALSYWGWQGDQRDTRLYLRPNFATVDDKNVNPAEMADYVEQFTELKALVRVGGDLDMLKRLVAAGFPVVIEKGFQPPKEDWMGHFEVINGYDDTRQRFITQDSYIMSDFPVPYEQLTESWWRDFNYVYLVIFPPEREAVLLSILGHQADPAYNYQHAAQIASEETQQLSGRDLYFAWFNLGSSLTMLQDYSGAATAYDQAFAQYANLSMEERPWRTLWYQDGPYRAYYYAGRYQDVIELANTTLAYLQKPVLEESFYWRGLAREQTGDLDGAISDLMKSVELNPNFAPGYEQLQRLGIQAP